MRKPLKPNAAFSEAEKARVTSACQRFIDDFLKPRFLPSVQGKPDETWGSCKSGKNGGVEGWRRILFLIMFVSVGYGDGRLAFPSTGHSWHGEETVAYVLSRCRQE